MKKILFLIFIGAFLAQCTPKTKNVVVDKVDFRSKAPTPKKASEFQFGDSEIFDLANGMKVIVVENDKVATASVRLFIDAAPITEKEKAGSAEFAGDLLSRGSSKYSKAELDEAIDFIGSNFNTGSRGFFISGLSKHIDKMMALASDAVLNPTFPEDEFEKIKTQKLSVLASNKDDANAISNNVSSVLNYGEDHPYGEIVTEETVNNITIDDCKNYYENYFGPKNSYLVFVGDIDANKAKTLAEKYFGKWNKKTLSTKNIPKVVLPTSTKVSFIPKRGAVQSVIDVTYPVELRQNTPDLVKAKVMNTLLGGFFRSRLNQNLREDNGYTYGIYSYLSPDNYIGSFSASASVRNEVTDSAIAQVLYEMDRLRTGEITQKEFDLVKNVMAGNFGRSLESPQTIANFALSIERFNLPKDFYKNYLKTLEGVTIADVKAMANKYIKPDKANIIVVGDKESVLPKLAVFGEVNTYDIYGKPMKEETNLPELTLDDLYGKHMDALGGVDAMHKIKSIETEYKADVQGMAMKIWEAKVNGEKMAMKMSVMGQEVQSKVFDGTNGYETVQGQRTKMEEEDLKSAKFSSFVFSVCGLRKSEDAKYLGSETVDGKGYYVVENTMGEDKTLYYFNAETFLIDFEEQIVSVQGQTQTMKSKYPKYKKDNGVLIPEKIVIVGAMPMPLEFNLEKLTINGKTDESVFNVD